MTVARELPKWSFSLKIFSNLAPASLRVCAPSSASIHIMSGIGLSQLPQSKANSCTRLTYDLLGPDYQASLWHHHLARRRNDSMCFEMADPQVKFYQQEQNELDIQHYKLRTRNRKNLRLVLFGSKIRSRS